MHAADHHDRQQLARKRDRRALRRHEVGLEAQQATSQSRHHRRKHECRELVALDRVALEGGAQLVLANRHQHMPERRAHHAQQSVQHAERNQGDQDVVGQRIVEIDGPDAAALQAAEAVLAAGHLAPAEGDGVGERRQRQRQQREIHAAPAQDEASHDGRQHGDQCHGEQDREPDLPVVPVLLDQRGGIGSDAEPRGMAERREAGVADQQVEPQPRDGQDHHQAGGVDRQAQCAHGKRQGNQRDHRHPQRPVLGNPTEVAHSNLSMRSPSRPRGRSSSTRNIST